MPTKRRLKGRKGSSYWQRWLVLIAAVFVFYTAFRPGPQVHSASSFAHDLSGEDANGGTVVSDGGVVSPQANDSRILPVGSPLSPVPRYGCPSIVAKRKLDINGNVSTVEMLKVTRSTYITKFSSDIHYAHMAMIEKIMMPDGHLRFVSAWQAAPRAPFVSNPNNGDRYQRVAVEGLPKQRIYWATSDDEGRSWSESQEVPPDPDAQWSAYWSPVLFYDESRHLLWLFYSVSNSCQKVVQNTTLWEPGGDIRAKQMSVGSGSFANFRLGVPRKSWTWGKGRTLLKEKIDGIPKVIANKPTVLLNGDWVMPFWREQPPKGNNNTCSKEEEVKSRHMYGHIANRTSSGVLISSDSGYTWKPYGDISEPRTNLIEGSLVEVVHKGQPELHCYFRAIVGYPPKGTNSTLENSLLIMAFNNHKRGQPGCTSCRTHLHLAASTDYGNTWTQIAMIEDEFVEGVRIHYPTMLQTQNDLHVIYSRFYLGKYNLDQCKINKAPCLGLYSKNQGIKFVTLDISSLYEIPQLYTKDMTKPQLSNTIEKILMALIDLRLKEIMTLEDSDSRLKKLQHFRSAKWDKVVNMIMNRFDVNNLGGIHEVRKQNQLYKFFQQVLDDRLQINLGKDLIKPRHEQKCTCKVHHPFSGMAFSCPCACRDDQDCLLLCFLSIANCGNQPQPQPSTSRVVRNSEEKTNRRRDRTRLKGSHR